MLYKAVKIIISLSWYLTACTYNNSPSSIDTNIEEGKILFEVHCSSCHDKNFNKQLTGPNLGETVNLRKKDWWISITKNNTEMLIQEDSLAMELYKEWGNVSMASFEEKLSNIEIEQIYEYVRWTTKK